MGNTLHGGGDRGEDGAQEDKRGGEQARSAEPRGL